MATELVVAERRKIGVVCRPVKRVPNRRHRSECRQHEADTVNLSQKGILQGAQQRPTDEHRPQTPACGQGDDDGPDQKASEQDQGERNQDARYRNADLQQVDRKERGAAVQRDRMDAEMQIEKVDGAVAKERHRTPRD